MIISYLKYQEEYSEKYGDKTLVLMQVGSFYECYSYYPEKDKSIVPWPKEKIGYAIEVASLLNMIATRENKKKDYALNNCDKAGFPCISYEKHRNVLLQNDYTIVRIDQKKDVKGNVERFVAEILSPATNFENIASLPITNNIVGIYIEVLKEGFQKEDFLLSIGVSSIDVTTGENSVSEIYSKEEDAVFAIQELFRFLSSNLPKEAIIYLNYKSQDKNKISSYEQFLTSVLKLNKIPVLIFKSNKLDPNFLKIDYATRFLSKLFESNTSKSIINPNIIEILGLERIYYGMISYLILLQYCYEHNETLIEKINKPIISFLDYDKYLILTHNAVNQIDLLPSPTSKKTKHNLSNKNIDSLFSVVNYTKTPMGKRYLLKMLANPITSVNKLNEIYSMVEQLISKNTLLDDLTNLLKHIPDIERYQRKLYLKIIQPNEFVILFQAYIVIVSLCTKIYTNDFLSKLYFDPSSFNECLSFVLSKYNLNSFENAKIDNGKLITDEKIFYDESDEKADKYWEEIDLHKKKIEEIVSELNSHLNGTKGKKIIYEDNDKKNLGLWTTPHKAKVLSQSSYSKEICGELQFVNVNKDVMITSTIIAKTCKNLTILQEQCSKYLLSCYNCTLSEISEKYVFFALLNSFIGKLDYICSNAKCAINNKYFKPRIENKNDNSYLEILEMRHPIVEVIIDNEYIKNDVSLGLTSKGMLLYGMNSCGKSTLVKAIGLNLILAQAGLFTAGKMTFYPYKKIITRLSSHDSIMTGESSFVIEMKELRTILRNADSSTLVLGDELSRGTESISATSLTTAAILYLIEKKSSFIFSTHLHNLIGMKEIEELENKLRICHLSLIYLKEEKTLIYDRKLKEGSGDSMYGLEVANSLGLNSNYIRKAYEIRNNIVKENPLFLSTKRSKYNSKVFVDACFLCGKRELDQLETHHKIEQHKFDKNDKFKNRTGNLIEICSSCHDNLHSNGLSIISLETSNGISLKVK